jgi:phosphoribosylaminoimidazolecarboxamide formyltransferase/IMP cyclohydrolase
MRALISVSDKTGLEGLAQGLVDRGVEIVSTGGTASALARAGLQVTNVSDVTGFPEMMDGRVKTLHPRIHGGILARRRNAEDLEALSRHDIRPIDLVVVNLYPFARAAADPATTVPDLIEQIDIGGPSLIRAAAKNFEDVLVVVNPASYARLLAELDRPDGATLAFRLELAKEAFAHTAAYDRGISTGLAGIDTADGNLVRVGSTDSLVLTVSKIRDLRYGENPHQKGWWYGTVEGVGFSAARVVQGKELSYTNLLDLDAALRIVSEFTEPAAVVIKHTNPCGAATADSAEAAYLLARDADALSAFGGIVGLNRPIDERTARALTATFIEAVVAPEIDDAALPILAAKPNLRVVCVEAGAVSRCNRLELRSIVGGVLAQERDEVREAAVAWPSDENKSATPHVVTRRSPTDGEWTALRFAWRLIAHVKSNAVIFTGADRTRAIGAGQMSRVDAVRAAVLKAGSLAGSVAASDAFFPFRDGLDAIAAAGATAIVQPGGSVRDAEVIAAADEHGLAMVFTGVRHFRH